MFDTLNTSAYISTMVICGSYMFEFSVSKYMEKRMIKGREVVIGKVAAHLCLTLIVKEFKISVKRGRVVTTLNLIKTLYILLSIVSDLRHIPVNVEFVLDYIFSKFWAISYSLCFLKFKYWIHAWSFCCCLFHDDIDNCSFQRNGSMLMLLSCTCGLPQLRIQFL